MTTKPPAAAQGALAGPLPLSVAVGDSDRSRALVDGRVAIDGVRAEVLQLSMQDMFGRSLRGPVYDVTELSLSGYVARRSAGDSPYIALPIFPSCAFRHAALCVRRDRIHSPADLRGARIGVPDYAMTPAVWVRAFLQDDHHVAPTDVQWVQAGLPGASGQRLVASLPAQLRVQAAPAGSNLWQLLANGELDAVIDPHPPAASLRREQPLIGSLFDDPLAESLAYFRRTRIFPVQHVVALRVELAEQHPWLPAALLRAFTRAHALAHERLLDTSVAAVALPLLGEHLSRVQQVMGEDFWPCGLRGGRAALEAFVRHHHEQGLSAHRCTVDELFHPSTLDS